MLLMLQPSSYLVQVLLPQRTITSKPPYDRPPHYKHCRIAYIVLGDITTIFSPTPKRPITPPKQQIGLKKSCEKPPHRDSFGLPLIYLPARRVPKREKSCLTCSPNFIILRIGVRNWGFGYSRLLQRPDGKVVTVYYFATPENRNQLIAANSWDPMKVR